MAFGRFKNAAGILSAILILLAACHKSVDENDPVVIGVKDSTLLIKSISMILYDQAGAPTEDSITEYYSYDSINHKIDLTWSGYAGNVLPGAKQTFHYDDNDQLTEIDAQFPVGYTPVESDYTKIQFQYDATHVLGKTIFTFYGGATETTTYQKTNLTAGVYRLDWLEFSETGDSMERSATFDANANNLISYSRSPYQIWKDSLIYDAGGNLNQVINTRSNPDGQNAETHTSYTFQSRLSKGDQLYNQRRALLNGIATIPFGNTFKGFTGILNFFPDGNDHYEYAKYPFQNVQHYNWDTGNTESFTATSVIDSKDRLTNFKGFYEDIELVPQEYKIVYFK